MREARSGGANPAAGEQAPAAVAPGAPASEVSALSPSEREELRTRGTRFLLVLILVLLAGALLLPRVAQRRIDRLRDEINLIAEPASARTSEIQLDLALEAAARRGLLLTGDPQLARDLERSRRRRVAAEQELAVHARQLDTPVQQRLAELASHLRGLDSLLDTARLAARRAAPDAGLVQHDALFDAALASADTLRAAIVRSEDERRDRIGATEQNVALLTAILLLLGLGASIFVARLGGRFHALAVRLQENEQRMQRSATSERTARAAAETRRVDLERVTESRTRLIRGFTHDVKNPLGAADGYLALLEDGVMGPMEARQREAIGKVRRAISQSLALIADLLELGRVEAGQLEIHVAPTDLAPLVREVADAYRPTAWAKGVELAVEVAPGLPTVHTDEVRVRQVLGNLVSNAVKYTPRDGHVQVRAGAGRGGDEPRDDDADAGLGAGDAGDAARRDADRRTPWVVLSVTDDGPGIAPEYVPRIFEEFTRFDPSAADGAGVGLAISQRIAGALGGTITVETEVGRGSTFALRLPAARP